MEGTDAMAQGFNGKVADLEEKLSKVQDEKPELESRLSKKDEETESLKTELDGAKIQN